MQLRRRLLLTGLAAVALLACARAGEQESNFWPGWVGEAGAAGAPAVTSWQAAGPLFFGKPATGVEAEDGAKRVEGFRPFWVAWRDETGRATNAAFLYPLWSYRAGADREQWSILNLINHSEYRAGRAPEGTEIRDRHFDLWPFYFSRDTGAPESSYHAVFPLYGRVPSRFFNDEVDWVLFPFYLHTEKRDYNKTWTPWPFIRVTRGGEHGFAFWPLFGHDERPGVSRRQYFLWPLIYNEHTRLDSARPAVQQGFLPFYTRQDTAEVRSENIIWPFFGYTHRVAPQRYDETRYFWPFLVQGRGDNRYVNRWGPLYTHSVVKGYDKKWYLWPLVRHAEWRDGPLLQDRTQFLYFLYWSGRQRSAAHPELPAAQKTHVWPLLSVWDNGAGRRQVQFLSPFEVFFPNNERVRETWTPLVALFRYDRRGPHEAQGELFWRAITWRRDADEREFHLGPLFSTARTGDERRIALGNGLISLRRQDGRWRFFWFDFPSKRGTVSRTSAR